MNDDTPITLKDACEIHFGGRISVATLKAEIGQTISGWKFADGTVLTSSKDVIRYKDATRFIGRELIDGAGIYIVGYRKFVKIGVSSNIRQRFATLRTSVPEILELIAVLGGALPEEQSIHRRFRPYRINGEWFRRAGALASWIDEGCK